MSERQHHDTDGATTSVEVTVLSMNPVNAGRILALADVELLVDGVVIVLYGVQVRGDGRHSSIHLPTTRDHRGEWKASVGLPEPVRQAMADVVQQAALEHGILRRVGETV